ncbi:amino acid adenylation domain-containing protein [Mariniflexile fucanivorans]|uniref:Amino acid adenylation domain-containing protein n=1 Tax=Mariniflexile fucanivorans TaxID=264023 RepID=A0A4R1RKF9_9FLAO|nr:polyketide synthase [Mariniflexile fucanivorans]TCL66681.1 amino acid adenylation domain-containing protein [Mariniflexile fucanivorans]
MHLNNLTPLYTIQGPALTYPISTLHELFEKQALATPEAIALEFEDEKISYDELQKRINKTAHYLWDKGIRPNQIVALSLDRNPHLIVSIFAILQCGASYVPIDTGYPLKRLELIVEDAKASFFISSASNTGVSEKSKNIFFEDILGNWSELPSSTPNCSVQPQATAYIIYTSGSTGKPKGVQVSHLNTINLVYSMGKEPGINKNDKIFAVTTISFDAMVMEIFLPLLHGACIVLIDEETRLDGEILLKKAFDSKISLMWGTPSIWQILLDSGWTQPLAIKALIGGEPVPLNLAHKLLELCSEVWNIYGPTETTVCAFLTKISKADDPITIGKPIANTHAYFLDEKGNPVAYGEIGEIAIGGDGVSLGYLNRPELTHEHFIKDPFTTSANKKMYLSGDLGKILPNGQVQCLGRKDNQVKVRGHRIELGEIETILDTLPNIKKNAVVVSNSIGSEPRLVAYLQSAVPDQDTNVLRLQLEAILPDYMIPSIFMWVTEFPITTNGKIDRKNLPQPEYVRPASAPLLKNPRTALEKNIASVWREQLQIPNIGIDDNFFEMGGTSLLTQKVVTLMKKRFHLKVPVTKIYQFPTIAGISKYIEDEETTKPLVDYSKQKENKTSADVAVIGMAIRFPGASTIEELWDVLKNGKETVSFFTPEELDISISETLRKDPLYVSARGVVPSAKYFDPHFFGINPKLAEAMDPQQRLFLEIAWEALEQSGYLPKHYTGSIGIYAGTGTNTYYKKNVLPNKELLNQVGVLQADTVNEKDYIGSRTAYHLNLKGPAVSIHSGCSTSLLAIAQAVDAIRNNRCDVALAGGSSVTAPINSGHLYQEGSMLSPDGHCRSFDANGKGTVFSDGAGVVLLKNLEAAKRDGDVIHGVIKGIGINNDGGDKGSFTAPSTEGQAGAISKALLDAQINPSEISYVETHGTATPVGDPIEMEGLRLAFGKQPINKYCAIGSIKSNMGHLTAAAGVAGLIKTILALKHKKIPASLGYEKPNPFIDFENSPFYVNNTLSDWTCEGKRRAGISSFGVGGTNVHIIAEAYETTPQVSGKTKPLQIITWSAKSENSLKAYKKALGNFIKSSPETNIADIACSLSATRDTFSKRSFILANGSENAFSQLLSNDKALIKSSDLKVVPANLAFLFPGQGAQYLQMGKALYEHETIFREAVDTCSEILLEAFKFDIRRIIYPEHNTAETEERLKDTQFTQPALFVVEYALSQLWMHWGIKPTLLCGHSVGEFVAAHLAGVFTLKDALILVGIRGKLVSNLPSGSMLSIRTTHENLTEFLPKELSIAAVNSDQLCVVSGENKAIEQFAKVLEDKNIYNKLLLTSHAFHSTMMDPILEAFEVEVRKVSLNVPRIPIISTVTGTYLRDAEATDPSYWTHHLRATVRFSDAMETALQLDDIVLLEVGPGSALTTLSKQKKRSQSASSISSLAIPNEHENAYHTVLNALGQLWLKGIEPNWNAYYKGQSRQKIWLPAYAFDRKLCWVEPPVLAIPHENFNTSVDSIRNHSIQPQIDTITDSINNQQRQPRMDTTLQLDRKSIILEKISDIILNTSGMELAPSEHNHSFLELGLDSLVLTQMAITCKNEFDTPITFRQLNGEFSTPNLLASHLDKNLPPDRFAAPAVPAATPAMHATIQNGTPISTSIQTSYEASHGNTNSAISLIGQQLQLLAKQIELLQGTNPVQPVVQQTVQQPVQHVAKPIPNPSSERLSEDEIKEHKKPFGASPKIEKEATELNTTQETFLKALTASYNKKTAGSKAYTQKHRSHMSDPRVVSGFKPLTKELVYPLVIGKSSGNKLWDVDGNEYIDALNGFGSCLFGHQPDFIKEALHNQIELGYEVGPQHPLAGEVSELLCELTQHDRAALCNTGSEAVLGAMRIARTVTGKSLIIAFSRSYHGIIDEALVRGSRMKKTFPAAPGIMPESVQNMLILDYGTEESLQIIRERAHELAAVLVEPLQSRRPEFQPVEFLKEVQNITKASQTALIFDEIITGFRMHPQGMQGIYGIKADIATYGKVIGGGLSIGAILGSSKYMDALDGGHWQFGDNSFPEVGVTYFAGTFVRHPLALASAKASLLHLKEQSPKLQDDLADMTEYLAHALNTLFKNNDLPMEINYYKSLWRLSFLEEIPYSELIFVLMREKGIHIWDGFPCFLTTAYNQEDLTKIIDCFAESIEKMTDAGIFKSHSKNESKDIHKSSHALNTPPQEGARLAIDEFGNPAWYLKDENKEGEYLKIEL